MNEQIADILNQPAFDRLKDWHDIGPVQKATLELFAQLIVQECMEVAGASYTSTPEDCVYYVDLAVNRIAEHFGVEE